MKKEKKTHRKEKNYPAATRDDWGPRSHDHMEINSDNMLKESENQLILRTLGKKQA